MRRLATTIGIGLLALMLGAPAASACGFLVSANGSVRLGRTTTFVAWEDGVEHYITNFSFSGATEDFGSLIPLPAEPTEVIRAGDWTLQRLQLEVAPPRFSVADGEAALSAGAEVILQTRIDSLDVVVLKGGAAEVLRWVNDNGFALPPGPETDHLLDYYASRSPYFLAARFDADAAIADGFTAGDGIPVQITIPTDRPWVPLHILHGAKPDSEIIEADVFLLTPERPSLLHGVGIQRAFSGRASQLLLDDLRSDENMGWVPEEGWLTHLELRTESRNLVYDLAVGVDGERPSFVDAGFARFEPSDEQLGALGLRRTSGSSLGRPMLAGAAVLAIVGGALAWAGRRHQPATATGTPVSGTSASAGE